MALYLNPVWSFLIAIEIYMPLILVYNYWFNSRWRITESNKSNARMDFWIRIFHTIVDWDKRSKKRSEESEEREAKWHAVEKECGPTWFNQALINIYGHTEIIYWHVISRMKCTYIYADINTVRVDKWIINNLKTWLKKNE